MESLPVEAPIMTLALLLLPLLMLTLGDVGRGGPAAAVPVALGRLPTELVALGDLLYVLPDWEADTLGLLEALFVTLGDCEGVADLDGEELGDEPWLCERDDEAERVAVTLGVCENDASCVCVCVAACELVAADDGVPDLVGLCVQLRVCDDDGVPELLREPVCEDVGVALGVRVFDGLVEDVAVAACVDEPEPACVRVPVRDGDIERVTDCVGEPLRDCVGDDEALRVPVADCESVSGERVMLAVDDSEAVPLCVVDWLRVPVCEGVGVCV